MRPADGVTASALVTGGACVVTGVSAWGSAWAVVFLAFGASLWGTAALAIWARGA